MLTRLWSAAFFTVLSLFLLPACQLPATFAPEPSKLTTIAYDYTDPMRTAEGHMLIEADGRIRVVERVGTEPAVVHNADTFLTKDQETTVLQAFKGWRDLKPFYPATFGPVFSISYNGYKVEAAASDSAAPALLSAKRVLDSVAGAALRSAPRPTVTPKAPAPAVVTYVLNSDVEYQFQMELSDSTLRRRISVARETGLLKLVEQTEGNNSQPPALNVKIHLTTNQLETLANTLRQMPEGDQRYPGIDKGPYFAVRYDGRTIISGGLPDTPSTVKAVQQLLEGYSQDAKRFPEDD